MKVQEKILRIFACSLDFQLFKKTLHLVTSVATSKEVSHTLSSSQKQ
jgi:hypothetical protein